MHCSRRRCVNAFRAIMVGQTGGLHRRSGNVVLFKTADIERTAKVDIRERRVHSTQAPYGRFTSIPAGEIEAIPSPAMGRQGKLACRRVQRRAARPTKFGNRPVSVLRPLDGAVIGTTGRLRNRPDVERKSRPMPDVRAGPALTSAMRRESSTRRCRMRFEANFRLPAPARGLRLRRDSSL